MGHVAHGYGDGVAHRDDRGTQVVQILDEADAADDVLHAVDFHGPGPHLHVGHLHGPEHVGQADPGRAHGVWVHLHEVLAHETAHPGHLADAVGGHEGVAHVPVLDGADLVGVPASRGPAVGALALDGVPEHLAQGRGVGAQGRAHAVGQRGRRQGVEFFQKARAGPVELHVLVEDDVDRGKPEHGIGAHRLYAGHAQQRHGQGIGDLVLDILGGTAGPGREDDLLVLADVGDGVHGHRVALDAGRVPGEGGHEIPPPEQHEHHKEDDQLLFETEADDAVHGARMPGHGRSSFSWRFTSPQRSMEAPK